MRLHRYEIWVYDHGDHGADTRVVAAPSRKALEPVVQWLEQEYSPVYVTVIKTRTSPHSQDIVRRNYPVIGEEGHRDLDCAILRTEGGPKRCDSEPRPAVS